MVMTPKERAETLWAMTRCNDTESSLRIIEQNFVEVVEEDRASRECCKQEREECAQILDDWAEINTKYDREYEAQILRVAAASIRARSEKGD
jgi:hypothetical protein